MMDAQRMYKCAAFSLQNPCGFCQWKMWPCERAAAVTVERLFWLFNTSPFTLGCYPSLSLQFRLGVPPDSIFSMQPTHHSIQKPFPHFFLSSDWTTLVYDARYFKHRIFSAWASMAGSRYYAASLTRPRIRTVRANYHFCFSGCHSIATAVRFYYRQLWTNRKHHNHHCMWSCLL